MTLAIGIIDLGQLDDASGQAICAHHRRQSVGERITGVGNTGDDIEVEPDHHHGVEHQLADHPDDVAVKRTWFRVVPRPQVEVDRRLRRTGVRLVHLQFELAELDGADPEQGESYRHLPIVHVRVSPPGLQFGNASDLFENQLCHRQFSGLYRYWLIWSLSSIVFSRATSAKSAPFEA